MGTTIKLKGLSRDYQRYPFARHQGVPEALNNIEAKEVQQEGRQIITHTIWEFL